MVAPRSQILKKMVFNFRLRFPLILLNFKFHRRKNVRRIEKMYILEGPHRKGYFFILRYIDSLGKRSMKKKLFVKGGRVVALTGENI